MPPKKKATPSKKKAPASNSKKTAVVRGKKGKADERESDASASSRESSTDQAPPAAQSKSLTVPKRDYDKLLDEHQKLKVRYDMLKELYDEKVAGTGEVQKTLLEGIKAMQANATSAAASPAIANEFIVTGCAPGWLHCTICDIDCHGNQQMINHLNGSRHKRRYTAVEKSQKAKAQKT